MKLTNYKENKFPFSDEFIINEATKVADEYSLELVEIEDTDKVRVLSFTNGTSYLYFTLINNTNEVEVIYNNDVLFKGELLDSITTNI